MSYKVLSRKYRPKIFNDVIGQENPLTVLKSFIQSKSIPHALIFCGSRGIGKTSMARIFAKTINCENLKSDKDCSGCTVCKEIDENKSLDVIEIDAASNNGVDQIRELIDSSNYSSINCEYKIFIIDEVHMLSKAAFNALLKTLEEPNDNTIFILATTEVEKIPLTILSRCQVINFKVIKKEELIKNLKNICSKESISIDDESLSLIAEESQGSARDSLGILEQLMTSLSKKISIEGVRKILGVTSNQILFQVSSNLLASNVKECLKNYDEIYKKGQDSKKFVYSLLNYFRSAIYYKLGIQDDIEGLISIEESEIEELCKHDIELFENLFDELIKLYEQCNKTENIKFLIESNLIKLCLISNYINLSDIVDDTVINTELDDAENKLKERSERPKNVEKEKPMEKKSLKKKDEQFNASLLLDHLKNLNDENHKLLKSCKFKVENLKIVIDTQNSLLYEILKEDKKILRIEDIVSEIFGSKFKIAIVNSKVDKNSPDSEDFKFAEKKDKLFESETIKNLFSNFDCRVLNIEKDN